MIALYVWTSLVVFYTLYIAAVNIAGYWKDLTLFVKLFTLPIVVVMLTLDFLMNMTLFTVLFLDLPHEYLVTSRLKRYRATEPNSWRGKVAAFICTQALNPFDPSRKHC